MVLSVSHPPKTKVNPPFFRPFSLHHRLAALPPAAPTLPLIPSSTLLLSNNTRRN